MTFYIDQDVSRETMERLRGFEQLVQKWNPTINLVSKNDLTNLWERHIVDSLQVANECTDYEKWVDIGSGGGFPGVVVAILAKEKNFGATHTLIESDIRKCTFLRTAIRELDLNATVITKRIEETEPQQADVLSARALSSLDKLFGFAERHLKKEGKAIFPKGQSASEEIAEAEKGWKFSYRRVQSTTNPEASLLVCRNIQRV